MRIKLKRDGWHRKLQAYVFGLESWEYSYNDIDNFCPYFWLTIACLVAVPFVCLWRTGKAFIEKIATGVERTIEYGLVRPIDWLLYDMLGPSRVRAWEPQDVVKAHQEDSKLFKLWKKMFGGDDWFSLYQKIEKQAQAFEMNQIQKDQAERERRHQKTQARQRRMRQIAAWSQKLFPALALSALALLCYSLYRLIVFLYDLVVMNWEKTLKILIAFGIIALVILVIVGLVIGLKHWVDSRPHRPLRKLGERGLIMRGVCAFFRPLGIFFEFVGTYLAAAKENYCPSIEWNQGDET